MLNLNRILVPTDLSPSARRAADLAGALADKYDAEIHLLHVTTIPERGPLEGFFAFLFNHPDKEKKRERIVLERLDKEMRAHLGELQRPVIQAERRGSSVAMSIVDYAVEFDIDLIAMGTHGHRSLEHALGGTAGEVLRRAGRPVLTVRDHKALSELEGRADLDHILVPVDFSHPSRDAIRVAADLAERFDSTVSLLFVAEERTIPVFNDTGLPTLQTLRLDPEILENAEAALESIYREVAGPGTAAAVHVRTGNPAREILTLAGDYAPDLIVMSRHGQDEEEIPSLGSVTERVARRAGCPVLSLDPLGRSLLA